MTVWIVFLDFLIEGGDLRLQPRVFTVLIYPALFDQMLRAATPAQVFKCQGAVKRCLRLLHLWKNYQDYIGEY